MSSFSKDFLFKPISWFRREFLSSLDYREWFISEYFPYYVLVGESSNSLRHYDLEHIESRLASLSSGDADSRGSRGLGGSGGYGILAGVPLGHKEIICREGWLCEAGSASRLGLRCSVTSEVLRRCDLSGAIDCGQLSSVEYALGVSGHNGYVGVQSNPWRCGYISGGSSSGSAVLVGMGLIPASIGTDTGGSVRIPASVCGLVGLKPTFGLVSRSGIFELSSSLDTVGVMSRSVEDCELLFEVIRGYDASDSASIKPDDIVGQGGLKPLKDLRLALARGLFFDSCDSAIFGLLSPIIDDLRGDFIFVGDIDLPDVIESREFSMLITGYEAGRRHGSVVLAQPDNFQEQTRLRILEGLEIGDGDYRKALHHREGLIASILGDYFDNFDILLAPALPFGVPTIEETDVGGSPLANDLIGRLSGNFRYFNYLGFPALSIPVGRDSNGLPVSIQLVGRPFSEANLFALARFIESKVDFWSRKPPF